MAGHAAPGDTFSVNGSARAIISQPPQVTALEELRFGIIMSPAANGTVTVTPGGTVTSTLDLTAFPSTRAPARFLVHGERNTRFITTVSNSTVIVNQNGTPMVVSNLTYNRPAAQGQGQAQHNRTGNNGLFDLYVGGTLNVRANQEAGQYSGVFDVTVVFL
ncbi:MAG: DUF4402 domain-containing protein [Erythrobacter sp.]